ncbi:hypothetical protein [Qipengyuania spongiae]|uniref:Uncharacterized protein n=1 Tax=Qipengyuania spongiae TaxID=2909673 RepID=A0ABY5SYC6_9SPHN|nr:hypothetical protein [Qipengyuania spongiae]UVI39542.1 hypothetical protein L1F33_00830 [Qipengyuania spongiae]
MIALVRMVSGLILWAGAFSVLYALHGLGCSLGWTDVVAFGLTQAKAALIATWGSLIVAHALLVAWLRRSRETQIDRIAIAIGWIGLFATLVGGFPVFAISSCV